MSEYYFSYFKIVAGDLSLLVLSFFAENKNVKNFQYSQSVDYQKRDKPPLVAIFSCLPQRYPLPGNGPGKSQKNNPRILN
jgi:hypothetical protein